MGIFEKRNISTHIYSDSFWSQSEPIHKLKFLQFFQTTGWNEPIANLKPILKLKVQS